MVQCNLQREADFGSLLSLLPKCSVLPTADNQPAANLFVKNLGTLVGGEIPAEAWKLFQINEQLRTISEGDGKNVDLSDADSALMAMFTNILERDKEPSKGVPMVYVIISAGVGVLIGSLVLLWWRQRAKTRELEASRTERSRQDTELSSSHHSESDQSDPENQTHRFGSMIQRSILLNGSSPHDSSSPNGDDATPPTLRSNAPLL